MNRLVHFQRQARIQRETGVRPVESPLDYMLWQLKAIARALFGGWN